MALEETKVLEDMCMADCKGVSFSEFYPELVGEIEHLDYEYIKNMVIFSMNASSGLSSNKINRKRLLRTL